MAFMNGIHRSPVNSPQKGSAMRKIVPFVDIIMFLSGFQRPNIWADLQDTPKQVFVDLDKGIKSRSNHTMYAKIMGKIMINRVSQKVSQR